MATAERIVFRQKQAQQCSAAQLARRVNPEDIPHLKQILFAGQHNMTGRVDELFAERPIRLGNGVDLGSIAGREKLDRYLEVLDYAAGVKYVILAQLTTETPMEQRRG